MPAMNPSKDAMSVVMVQFSPEAATTKVAASGENLSLIHI